MKQILLKITGLLVLLVPTSSWAVLIEVTGTTSSDGLWDVSYVEGPLYTDTSISKLNQITEQEWFNNLELASIFALAVGDSLNSSSGLGPFFVDRIHNAFLYGCQTAGSDVHCYQPVFNPDKPFTDSGVPIFYDLHPADVFSPGRFAIASRADITTSVPEPSTIALLGAGLAGIGFAKRKKTTK